MQTGVYKMYIMIQKFNSNKQQRMKAPMSCLCDGKIAKKLFIVIIFDFSHVFIRHNLNTD